MLVVLGAASIVVPLVRRLHISPVIGFLGAGVVFGPNGLGLLVRYLPPLRWITISDQHAIETIAEFGVVFLLFVIGLELSLPRLMTMRRLVFGLGLAQVAVSAAVILAVGWALVPHKVALILALALPLSSTAIVLEVLAGQSRVASTTGRVAFAVLILQDLAVVPILFLVDALGADAGAAGGYGLVLAGIGLALGKAILTIVGIVAAGYFLLRPLFRLVSGRRDTELFMAATLFVAIGTAVVSAAAGLSMALGAFIAGLLLAETEYRRAIEVTIEPFKSLLLGVFFFAVGMSLDLTVVVAHPLTVAASVLALVLAKGLVIAGLGRLFRLPGSVSLEAAGLLAPAGEFAFVVFSTALAAGALTPADAGLAVAVASVSMALIPVFGAVGRRLGKRLEPRTEDELAAAGLPPDQDQARALVIGFGRVGRLVADMLERHKVPYLAIDADPRTVSRGRAAGKPVSWGDATNQAFLEACGLSDTLALIVTINEGHEIDAVVKAARALRPDLAIVARARDAAQARALYGIGVTDAVPETVEASLQLSEAALVGLGIATGRVIASIHERREEFRHEFQGIAGRPTRAVSARRTPATETLQS